MSTRYFTDSLYTPTALVRRRSGHLDDAFVNGVWRRSSSIMEWMVGENDFVDEISEAEARTFAPGAYDRPAQFSEPHYCDEHDVFECPDCNPPMKEA